MTDQFNKNLKFFQFIQSLRLTHRRLKLQSFFILPFNFAYFERLNPFLRIINTFNRQYTTLNYFSYAKVHSIAATGTPRLETIFNTGTILFKLNSKRPTASMN